MDLKENEQPITPNEYQSTIAEMLDMFYSQPITFTDDNNQPFEIPEDGTLSLLAMGHRGIIAWRKKRKEIATLKANKNSNYRIIK